MYTCQLTAVTDAYSLQDYFQKFIIIKNPTNLKQALDQILFVNNFANSILPIFSLLHFPENIMTREHPKSNLKTVTWIFLLSTSDVYLHKVKLHSVRRWHLL